MQADYTASKRCPHCVLVKGTDQFGKNKRRKDGLQDWCKECRCKYRETNKERINQRNRQYYEVNKELFRARSVAYREANKDAMREMGRRYYVENKEWINARNREYYYEHREKSLQGMAEYRVKNRAHLNVISRNYFARKRQAKGSYTFDDVWGMYESQQGLCAYCEMPLFATFHVDHMVPLSRGGSNSWTNLAVSCIECNLSKGSKTVEEFIVHVREGGEKRERKKA